LGANISGEVNGQPGAGGNSDTADDGIAVVGGILQPGENTIQVTVSGVGGSLTGWIDWNKNGQFSASERLIWSDLEGNVLGGEADLEPGTHQLVISSPGVNGPLAARFRWGEQGLNFSGPATIGEVEDYFLQSSTTAMLLGDYSNDGKVDMGDYIVWRKANGTSTVLPNDMTPGTVNQSDYVVWQQNYGLTQGAGGGGGSQSGSSGSGSESGGAAVNPWASLPFVAPESWVFASPPASPSAPSSVTAPSAPTGTTNAAPTFSALAIDLAVSDSPLSFKSAISVVSNAASVSGTSADANLLLLDQVLADLSSDDADEPIADRFGQEDDCVGDLELAAAFEDESNWWGV
jgi:hypothetical protein